MPSLHETVGSRRYLAHDNIPEAMNGDDISIRTIKEIEKYECLHHREFAHTRVYDVNLLRGLVWMRSFPSLSGPSVGGKSTTGLV
jgi:hypothetical protein